MADDFVPASPILRKTQKRKSSILKRRAKRRRGKTGDASEVSVSESVNEESLQHAVGNNPIEDDPQDPNPGDESPNDISAFYWPDESQEAPADPEDFDIFAEVRNLEAANRLPLGQTIRIPPELVENEHLITFDVFSQAAGGGPLELASDPKSVPHDTQFATETEFLRVCQVVDAVSDLHANAAKLTQWESPFAKFIGGGTSTPANNQHSTKRHDGSLDNKHSSSFGSTPRNRATSFQAAGTSYARLKHSRELEKPARKRINFYNDSDSKSSVSSGLSVQNDEAVPVTPVDTVDLERSQHVHENLQNLSSFFSQSFVQDDVDVTTNGIFRYIMMLKSKRKSATMIRWFRSGRNFAVNKTGSSHSFEGFAVDNLVNAESSAASSDRVVIEELLENGVDYFEEVSAEMVDTVRGVDIESILKSADDILFRASQLEVRGSEGDDEVDFRTKTCSNEPDRSKGANDVDIVNLLHGHILSTPKVNKFSESTIADSSPIQWVMRPKLTNSITASDIEFDSELATDNRKFNDNLNSTFIIDKSMSALDHNDSFGNITEIPLPHIDPYLDQKVDIECEKALGNISRLPETTKRQTAESPFAIPDVPTIRNSRLDLHEFKDANKPIMIPAHGACPRFTSASGKSVTISENALKLAERMMDDIMLKEFDEEMMPGEYDEQKTAPDNTVAVKASMQRISEKAGKSLYVSEAVQRRAEKLPVQCETNINQIAKEEPITSISSNLLPTGFMTASRKKLFISHAAQRKADQLAAECEANVDPSTVEPSIDLENANSIRNDADREHLPKRFKGAQENVNSDRLQKGIRSSNLITKSNIENIGSLANHSALSMRSNEKSLQSHDAETIREHVELAPAALPINLKSFASCSFRTASKKDISISENARQKAMKMMLEEIRLQDENIHDVTDVVQNESTVVVRVDPASMRNENVFEGFRTALGSEINISENAVQRAAKIMAGIGDSYDDFVKGPLVDNAVMKPDQTEEQFDGKCVPVSNLKSANCSLKTAVSRLLTTGFQCASRKPIQVSEKALAKAKQMMIEVEIDNSQSVSDDQNHNSDKKISKIHDLRDFQQIDKKSSGHLTTGFQCASRKPIQVSERALAIAKQMMAEEEDDNMLGNLKLTPTNDFVKVETNECKVLQTANEISETARTSRRSLRPRLAATKSGLTDGLSRSSSANVSLNLKKSSIKCQNTKIKFDKDSSIPALPHLSPATLSKSNARPNSTPNSRLAEPGILTPIRATSSLPISPLPETMTPQRSTPGQMKPGQRLSLTRKKFKPPAVVNAENANTPIRPIPLHMQISTPNFNDFFHSAAETSTPKNANKLRARQKFSLTQEVSASTAALLLDDEAESRCNDSGVRKISWDIGVDESSNNTMMADKPASSDVLEKRAEKREEQMKIIESKRCFQGFVKSGALFVKKTRPNRMRLGDLAENLIRPMVLTLDAASVLDYKFAASCDEVAIATEDGSFIVPNDANKTAYSEIRTAFLSIPSVAPNLVPTNWIQHHYRMIVLKLDWLESLHPGFLNPQNVCMQLKYRYDHEIDRAHRLAIQRVLECDDSPSKRMVLVVLAIHIAEFKTELELSDRWYSVRTVIDAAMQSLIDTGKVRVGTKLMLQSSELLNCEDGCSPLDIPPNVRVKIHTNSTRRARWDTKLGFYKTKKPFLLNLRQVSMNGGLVTKLELCILRVYPSMYLRGDGKDGNALEFRSEKVEQQLKDREDVSKLSNIESVYSQIQEELEAERQSSSKRQKVPMKIQEITDPEELFNLLRFEGEIEAELSSQQRKSLADYQLQIHAEQMKEVERRVQDKLQNQPAPKRSRELLKLRVTDHRQPGTTALLSIWSPHSDLKNLLQERRVIEVTHVMPKEHHSTELQLTSTKLSQYRLLPDSHSMSQHLFRRITSIQEIHSPNFKPLFNEFDTCGLVVLIDDDPIATPRKKHHAKKFQSVFLADADTNILCLNFWAGVKDYGYEDVIRIHRFVTVNNLEWRSNSANGPIPCAFATVTTAFTEKPKNEDMLHALANLKAHFPDSRINSTQEFVRRCQEKIQEIKMRPKSSWNSTLSATRNASSNLNNSTNNASAYDGSSASMNATASFNASTGQITVQERIDKLRFYGNAPEVSPLQIKRTRTVRRGFKVPMKIDDNSRSEK